MISESTSQHDGLPGPLATRWWDIVAWTSAAGVIVWAWLTWQQALINKDGVRYVASAESVLAGDWSGALHAYPWPFHPILMAGVSFISGLSPEWSGYVLNLACFFVVIVSFLAILRELGATRPVLIFGAVLLLLHPDLNHTLPGIFRDQGYWAFYLLGLWAFLRFLRTGGPGDAVLTSLALLMATLFRIEGLIILAALPLVTLVDRRHPWRVRLFRFGKAVALPFGGVIIVVIIVVLDAGDTGTVVETRLHEPFERGQQLLRQFQEDLPQRAEQLTDAVLSRHSAHQSFGALLAVYGYILIASAWRGVNWLYLVLGVTGFVLARQRMSRPGRVALYWLAIVNVLLFAAFVLQEQFLSHRYVVGLTFIVMAFAAFALPRLRETADALNATWKMKAVFLVPMGFLVIVGLDGLITTGAPAVHERDAGRWLAAHVPADRNVFIQSMRVTYYAARPYQTGRDLHWSEVRNVIETGDWQGYDYLALTVGHRDLDRIDWLRAHLNCEPEQASRNRRGAAVLIYDTRQCAPASEESSR